MADQFYHLTKRLRESGFVDKCLVADIRTALRQGGVCARTMLDLASALNNARAETDEDGTAGTVHQLAILVCNQGLVLADADSEMALVRSQLNTAQGIANWFMQRPAEAALCFDKARTEMIENGLQNEPQYLEVVGNLGLAHQAQSNAAEAVLCFREVVEGLGDAATKEVQLTSKLQLANALADDGQWTAAAAMLDAVRPTSTKNTDLLVRWNNARALIAQETGELKLADNLFDEIHDVYAEGRYSDPRRGAALTNAARFKIAVGWFAQARAIVTLAINLKGRAAPFSFAVGLAKTRLQLAIAEGDKDIALKELASALQLIGSEGAEHADQRIELALILLSSSRQELVDKATAILEPVLFPGITAQRLDAIRGEKFHGLIAWIEQKATTLHLEALKPMLLLCVQEAVLRGQSRFNWKIWNSLSSVLRQHGLLEASVLTGKIAMLEISNAAGSMERNFQPLKNSMKERRGAVEHLRAVLARMGRFSESETVRQLFRASLVAEMRTLTAQPTLPFDQIQLLTEAERKITAPYFAATREGHAAYNECATPYSDDGAKQLLPFKESVESFFESLWLKGHQPSQAATDSTNAMPIAEGMILFKARQSQDTVRIEVKSWVGERTITLSKLDELAKTLSQFRDAILDRSHTVQFISKEVHDLLIAPFIDLFPNQAELLIDAEGMIAQIPFCALWNGRQYLVENHTVVHGTKLQKTAKSPKEVVCRMLACGFSGAGEGQSELKYVPDELNEISAGVPTSKICLNENFTMGAIENWLAQRSTNVHIASHFEFQPGNPLGSFLVLGEGQRVPLFELLNPGIKWENCGVVFMSCCESHNTFWQENSELSIADVFLDAGVSVYVGTLWKVADRSALAVATSFHRALNVFENAALALQQAQIEALASNDCSHPFHWAGYNCSQHYTIKHN